MTNNPTIDGVSRELLEQSEAAFKALLKQITEEDEDGDYWRARFESRRDQLRALLDAPVVERQPLCYQARHSATEPWFFTDKPGYWEWRPVYLDSPEVAALQSTIAQLQARITQLESEAMYAAAGYQAARDRITELESGKISALADGIKALERIGTSIDARQQRIDAHTAPPAPVEVALPGVDTLAQIIRTVDGNHSLGAGALAERILDATAALNEAKK